MVMALPFTVRGPLQAHTGPCPRALERHLLCCTSKLQHLLLATG